MFQGLLILYISRIKKYSVFEVITIPDLKNTKNMSVKDQKQKEGIEDSSVCNC